MKELIVPAFILFFIVLSGFIIRVIDLSKTSISHDEPLQVYAAKSILETGKPSLPSGMLYTRAVLFTHLVALSFKFFGINEFAARFPSVIFGTLSILLIFFIGKRFFGTTAGLIAASLLAILPFEVIWSRTCRMYAMYQFFFLSGLFAFYNGFEYQISKRNSTTTSSQKAFAPWLNKIPFLSSWNLRWRWLFLSIISLLISFHLQALSGLFYISILSYLFLMLMFTLIAEGVQKTTYSKYLVSFLILASMGIISFLLTDIHKLVKELYEYSPTFFSMKTSPTYYYRFLMSPFLFPIGAFFIVGIIQICMRAHKAGFYTFICTGVPLILLSFFVKIQLPRYIFDIFPLIVLISSYSLYNFFESEQKLSQIIQILNKPIRYNLSKKLVHVVTICLFFLIFLPAPFWFNHVVKIIKGIPDEYSAYGGMFHAQYKEACEYVRNNSKPNDVIVAAIPLAADFYRCGNIKYKLDNGDIEFNRKLSSNEFLLDLYSNAQAITNEDELKKAILINPRGWLVLDKTRFERHLNIPREIKEFVEKNLIYHDTKAKGIVVYSWDETLFRKF